jgi:hypothetical protein
MTMNEIFVIGFGILVYDNDYNFFEGFIKEFNLAHDTDYNIFYDEYNETKPIFICKTGLIKLNYEPFKMDELQKEISFEDYQNFKKIKSTFSEDSEKNEDILIISKPSLYIFNYLS